MIQVFQADFWKLMACAAKVAEAARLLIEEGHSEAPFYAELRDHDEYIEKLAAALKEWENTK